MGWEGDGGIGILEAEDVLGGPVGLGVGGMVWFFGAPSRRRKGRMGGWMDGWVYGVKDA